MCLKTGITKRTALVLAQVFDGGVLVWHRNVRKISRNGVFRQDPLEARLLTDQGVISIR